MPYTQYTLAQFTADVSQALLDPGNVHWSVDEVQRAIKEALLVWGGLSNYWQNRGIFNTAANTAIYDLSTLLPALRSRAYTFDNLTREVQYHLYEPSTGVVGTGMSQQFNISQVLTALGRARNDFVLEARQPLTDLEITGINVPPPNGRVPLPGNICLLSHLWWHDGPSNVWSPLRRTDEWAADAYLPNWTTSASTPFAYSTIEVPPLTLQLYPQPSASGAISAFSVQTVDYVANPIAANTVLNVPDEWAAAVKWGAIYSVLSTDNESFDPLRAAYAKARWDSLAGAAMASMRSVIRARFQGNPIQLGTVWGLDATSPNWRNLLGVPALCACAFDLVVFSPSPNAVYSIALDVCQSAPLPVLTTDFIQVDPSDMSYLFDYVRHILSFKLGGSEFQATLPLYDNFLRGAKLRNKINTAKSQYLTPLLGQPRKEADQMVPA